MSRQVFVQTEKFTIGNGGGTEVINAPNKSILLKAEIIQIGSTSAFAAVLYNRAFTWSAAINLVTLTNDGNSKVLLTSVDDLPLAVGDLVTVAGSTVGGYNTTHRVTSVVGPKKVVTDVAYTAAGTGGTVTLAISTVEKNLYKVASITGVSGLGEYTSSVWMPVINADPLPYGRASKDSTPIYLNIDTAAAYRASLTFMSPWQ
jgi:hypothetical protein